MLAVDAGNTRLGNPARRSLARVCISMMPTWRDQSALYTVHVLALMKQNLRLLVTCQLTMGSISDEAQVLHVRPLHVTAELGRMQLRQGDAEQRNGGERLA